MVGPAHSIACPVGANHGRHCWDEGAGARHCGELALNCLCRVVALCGLGVHEPLMLRHQAGRVHVLVGRSAELGWWVANLQRCVPCPQAGNFLRYIQPIGERKE